jgi:hypothetical protein
MKLTLSIILTTSLLLLNGCIFLPIEHNRSISPNIKGIILDSSTDKPIEGAQIRIRSRESGEAFVFLNDSSEEPPKEKIFETLNSSDGTFSLDPLTAEVDWYYIWLIGSLEGTCGVEIFVTHKDYSPFKNKVGYFGSAAFDGVCDDRRDVHVEVRLERLGSHAEPE